MSTFKRGNVYWYEFVFNGERFRASTKVGNRRAAEQIEAAAKTRLAKAEVGIEERSPAPIFRTFAPRFRDAQDLMPGQAGHRQVLRGKA